MPDTASISVAREVMDKYSLYPKKSLGQNFLVDKNILKKIVESCDITADEYVVEIGPGLGSLTRELASKARGVLAIDIDSTLKPVLKELKDEYTNISLLFADILKTDIEAELKKAFQLDENISYKVCANIPYNITTPIIFHLLENCSNMESATLMMQKEVSKRLLASPGSKDYGRLTLTTAYYADIKHVTNVSHNCFYPRPEVDSAVVRIKAKQEKDIMVHNEDLFKELLRAAFQKRRKTILNVISGFFKVDKEYSEEKLRKLGIKPELRPENLTIDDFANLVNAFYS